MSRLTEKIKRAFYDMKQRCYNQNNKAYKDYGGRGIKVCDEWLNDINAFVEWSLKNNVDFGLSIDRIDNNGNYEPSNCRWATCKQQSNNIRTNRKINDKSLSEIAEETGINRQTICYRYDNGYDTLEKIKQPVKNHQKKLNFKIAKSIREEYSKGNISQRKLAKKYGVAKNTITQIIRGINYNENKRTDI